MDHAVQKIEIFGGAEYVYAAPSRNAFRFDRRNGCVVMTVRPGDRAGYDRARGRPFERAELLSRFVLPFGRPTTIRYFQYIAPGSTANVPAIIGQLHNSAEAEERPLPAIIAMQAQHGVQRILTHAVPERLAPKAPVSMVRWSAPQTVGRWVHWIWEITPDPLSGHLRVWRDGASIVDAAMPLGYNDPRGPYWQFGIYRVRDVGVMRVAYADVTIRPGAAGPIGETPPPPRCSVEPVG
ncbi:heparin lyase I family protein [Sphingobium aquiterrae]|uniref:heparin lyase I family protein n=1 Tax=Sphingobium aquiterrae TaxID=2038656 RepID=UPI003AFA0F42